MTATATIRYRSFAAFIALALACALAATRAHAGVRVP